MVSQHSMRTQISYLSLYKVQSRMDLLQRDEARETSLCLPTMGFVWKTGNYDTVSLPCDNNKTLTPVAFRVTKEYRHFFFYPRQQVDRLHFCCFSQVWMWRTSHWMLEKMKKQTKQNKTAASVVYLIAWI